MKTALSRPTARAALLQELEEAIRRSSAQGVIFGQTVANVAGISNSDLECLDFLNLEGRVTAGRLAEVTGLTTGAITGVIDRLEQAGFAQRERDAHDRRKVLVKFQPGAERRIMPLFKPMERASMAALESYSDKELSFLLEFLTRLSEAANAAMAELRAQPKSGKAPKR
jgi:DNA-binding MarR family transcriptional regulator